MVQAIALSVLAALLAASLPAVHAQPAEMCEAIGKVRLGMSTTAASRLLTRTVFEADTIVPGMSFATSPYTIPTQSGATTGKVQLAAFSGRIRYIHFEHSNRNHLDIENCGASRWSRAPQGNPGSITECREIKPHVELLINRSGPGVSVALLDTRYATESVSASEARVVARQACVRGG